MKQSERNHELRRQQAPRLIVEGLTQHTGESQPCQPDHRPRRPFHHEYPLPKDHRPPQYSHHEKPERHPVNLIKRYIRVPQQHRRQRREEQQRRRRRQRLQQTQKYLTRPGIELASDPGPRRSQRDRLHQSPLPCTTARNVLRRIRISDLRLHVRMYSRSNSMPL